MPSSILNFVTSGTRWSWMRRKYLLWSALDLKTKGCNPCGCNFSLRMLFQGCSSLQSYHREKAATWESVQSVCCAALCNGVGSHSIQRLLYPSHAQHHVFFSVCCCLKPHLFHLRMDFKIQKFRTTHNGRNLTNWLIDCYNFEVHFYLMYVCLHHMSDLIPQSVVRKKDYKDACSSLMCLCKRLNWTGKVLSDLKYCRIVLLLCCGESY